MKVISIISLLFFVGYSFAQISSGDANKLTRLLEEHVSLPISESYNYVSVCSACEVDTSLTLPEDTVGLIYQNEYVLFRDPIAFESSVELVKWMPEKAVSNADYKAFTQWVRDSIAFDKLYFGLESYESSDSIPKELIKWRKSPDYTVVDYMSILSDMYLPVRQQAYGIRRFDQRKLFFRYFDNYEVEEGNEMKTIAVEKDVPVMNDNSLFAKHSSHPFDVYARLSELYSTLDTQEDEPVIGLTGIQANAYCAWLEGQIQQKINKSKLPYRVRISLPTPSDIDRNERIDDRFYLRRTSFMEEWHISFEEYQEYVRYVRDSTLREYLFYGLKNDESALDFLLNEKLFFDEVHGKYVKIESAGRQTLRKQFALNYKKKINVKNLEVAQLVAEFDSLYADRFMFRYSWIDWKAMSIVGELEHVQGDLDWTDGGWPYFRSVPFDRLDEATGFKYSFLGKDLNLDHPNRLNEGHGVRAHADYQRFFIEEQIVARMPEQEQQDSEEFILPGISYEEALGFYHWKYPISKANHESYLYDYVFPSKEQFYQLKKGEKIKMIMPETQRPVPYFRYVIHFYSVKP